MTIAFKGCSAIKQYNAKKPDKWGYKAFVLSESETGYTLKWDLYTGKTDDPPQNNGDGIGAAHRVVRKLMNEYNHVGRIVYIDSYYSCIPLAKDLADQQTGMCGTINANRVGIPVELKPANLPLRKGDDPVYMRNNKLLVVTWHDTKRVSVISTVHPNRNVEKRIRSKHSPDGFRVVKKPYCVVQYNSYMGGVDLAGQRMKTYNFPHRSRKWYMRIINALISICLVNAQVIHRSVVNAERQLDLKSFIMEVCTSLLEGYGKRDSVRPGRPITGDKPQRLVERHWLEPTGKARPQCVVCCDTSIPGGKKQTHFRCRQCGVALCAYPYNERYHTQLNYKLCHLFF
ncbi:piggyBac transposable element-derived protein 4-like [Liolophura sinensis]|uniref:piggyBac transposable element-derived protein 4-like n=1 Tax=Liolophura sinensis TaxID=3198878 RepID=UPI003159094B